MYHSNLWNCKIYLPKHTRINQSTIVSNFKVKLSMTDLKVFGLQGSVLTPLLFCHYTNDYTAFAYKCLRFEVCC